jgi:hypothetical protein
MPRRVNKIEDVNDALRELYEFMDYMKGKNIDLHRRRIINAHPSVDLYDYVVRKELIDRVGEGLTGRNIVQPTRSSGGGTGPTTTPKDIPADFEAYDKITFGIGLGRSVEVGSDVTPPYIWTNKATAKPTIIAVAANIPPVGDDLEFDVLLNGTPFVSYSLPAGTGSKTVLHAGISSGPTIHRYDVISLNVTQTGGTEGGRDVEIVVYCPLL